MKLIDILLRHKDAIAERGEATNYFAMDPDGRVFGYQAMPEPDIMGWSVPGIKNSTDGFGCLVQINPIDVLEGWQECIVTLKQYETALAAIEQGWNGEGMPPVGCKCEWQDKNTKQWVEVLVVYASEWVTVIRENKTVDPVELAIENYGDDARCQFRPIRSEADKKRTEAIHIIADLCRDSASNGHSGQLVYDAIAAGKVPGIRIE